MLVSFLLCLNLLNPLFIKKIFNMKLTTEQKIQNLITKIRKSNNITYEQMSVILTKSGYTVQSTSLRRLGVGKTQSIPVYLANGLVKCFGLSISTNEVLSASGYEFLLDDNLSDYERELIISLRLVPDDARNGIVQSLKMYLNTFSKYVGKLKESVSTK